MLIVNFVVCLLKESQHGYFTSSSFSLRAFFLFQLKFIFVFRTASNFSVQDSCTFIACFVIFQLLVGSHVEH
jgi:hypothetical protein